MAQNQRMIITIALAIVIIMAIGVFTYTTLYNPDETTNVDIDNDETNESTENEDKNDTTEKEDNNDEILLTITYQETNYTYTISDLEAFESFSGSGKKMKQDGEILGPFNYTGVEINTLFNDINESTITFNFSISASDGYTKGFTMNETTVEIQTYNEEGIPIENESITMIIAYKEDGEYLTDTYPLRIVFIGEDNPITSAGLWIKEITTIHIYDEK